jgi:hypothetical protein
MGFWNGDRINEDVLEDKIKDLEKENHELNLRMLKMRCCENCKHYDTTSYILNDDPCGIICSDYKKWEFVND